MIDQTQPPFTPPFTLLDFADLKRMGIPWSRAYINRLVRAGKFCAPLMLGPHTTRFKSTAVEEWLATRPTGIGAQRGRPAKRQTTKG